MTIGIRQWQTLVCHRSVEPLLRAAEPSSGTRVDLRPARRAILPNGWRDRLVRVQNANTAAVTGKPQYTGWCLNKEDLCVAKLCALREKDRNFVTALLDAGLVDAAVIATRLAGVPQTHQAAAEQALKWLGARS